MKNLNNLQSYIVPDMELCKRLLLEYDKIEDYYKWKLWAIPEMQAAVRGHMPKSKAAKHIDWIFFYLKDKQHLIK